MSESTPEPPRSGERRARQRRAARIARKLGFVGRVEYQEVYSLTGGAQYGRAATVDRDLLTVYTEAFERDADPDDFSLAAILAHERGHQILARHERIAQRVADLSPESEEILASLLGAIIALSKSDRDALIAKAAVELLEHVEDERSVVQQLGNLLELLESLL